MSIASLSPFVSPDQWDQIIVNGVTWGAPPVGGRIKVTNAVRHHKFDEKDGPGLDGASQTYRGKRPKQFTLTFYMWTDAQFQLWARLSAQSFIYSGTKGQVSPVAVYHPSLVLLNVNTIIVEDLGAVEIDESTKMGHAAVRVKEYAPPPLLNATKTPKDVKVTPPGISGRPPNPALAELQARIAQVNAQISSQGTRGGLP